MRKIAPKLILQGNQREAKKWISWATKELERVKNLTVEGIANKVLRPITGVAVHVWSVNNIDRIRIAVSQKLKECDVAFTTAIAGLQATFTSTLTEPANRIFWNFGDGEYSTSINPVHTYEAPGDYTVTCKGYALGTFLIGNPGSPFLVASTESRTGLSGSSNAAAYSGFIADSWGASGVRRNEYSVNNNGTIWRYWGRRMNTTIPFQDFIGEFIPGQAIIYLTGTFLSYWRFGTEADYPVVEEVSGATGLGLSMRDSSIIPQDNIAAEIDSNVSLIETVIRPKDNEDYAILPDPPVAANEGWRGFTNATDQIGRLNVHPYTCLSTKQALITVT